MNKVQEIAELEDTLAFVSAALAELEAALAVVEANEIEKKRDTSTPSLGY